MIEKGKFPIPDGLRVVIIWPDVIKFKKPMMGMTELESWYEFHLENNEWNMEQTYASSLAILPYIEKESKLLNNDYSRIFMSGFSGGGMISFYVIFLHLQ